jgi:hypothetical protein
MEEMFCAYCKRPVEPSNVRHGLGGDFYCSNFCADSEYDDSPRSRTKFREDSDLSGSVSTT